MKGQYIKIRNPMPVEEYGRSITQVPTVGGRFVSPFGYTHPNDDKRQMCPYCFNEDTQRITDFVDLKPYQAHHNGQPFKAYICYCCGGKWHWSETPYND